MHAPAPRRVLLLALAAVALAALGPAFADIDGDATSSAPASAGQRAPGEDHQAAGGGDHAPGHDEAGGGHAPSDGGDHDAGSVHSGAGHGEGSHGGGIHGGGAHLGAVLPLWSVIPFAGILLSIAVFPLVAQHFWHVHYPKVAFAWALLFAVPFVIAYGHHAVHAILHIYLIDYVPFIILLWGLFTVAGGIVVRGSMRGKPSVNTLLLLIGTFMASWIGTTGAAMVLIRPVLRANAWRKNKTHVVVFFIFLVANVGGSLTPLGDPPLFLGFLHSVPFFWTFHLLEPMLVVVVATLAVFYVIDSFMMRREEVPGEIEDKQPLGLAGWHNFFFLAGIVAAVLLSGVWRPGDVVLWGIPVGIQDLVRDVVIIGMGLLSLATTSRVLRRENDFTWAPIAEVAYLFAGIFMTIIPALEILKAGEEGALGGLIRATQSPAHYFWMTGILSSFLDNAPTYLTFFNTALGKFYPGMEEHAAVARLIAENNVYLLAVSCGAVFMGANTYIGNAPNFMVKSIAEEAGVPMPSFFGYMLRWSVPILLPLFGVITLLFFIG